MFLSMLSPVRMYRGGAIVSVSQLSGWCLAEDGVGFFSLYSLFPVKYKLVMVFSKLFH